MDLINSDFALKTIIDEFNDYRSKLGELYTFDWISIPLVYTQAVGIAVYGFFIATLVGRQVRFSNIRINRNNPLVPSQSPFEHS